MSDKTPMIRFLGDEERRAQERVNKARERAGDERQSLHLQKKLREMGVGLTGDQADIVDTIITMMRERDELLKWRDFYDEAHYYLTRAGFGHPSGVEDMPTVVDMVEKALNHRSQIQGFHEAALTHLGISEEWQVRLRNGELDAFFEEFPLKRVQEFHRFRNGPMEVVLQGREIPGMPTLGKMISCACGVDYNIPDGTDPRDTPGLCPGCGGAPATQALAARNDRLARATEEQGQETERKDMEERALSDFTGAMEVVRGKLCHYLGIDSDVPWERLTPAVEKVVTDLANVKAESANVFLAVNVVREHLWKVREVAAGALGEEVPETTGDEHTAIRYVERLIESLEREQASHRQDNEMWDVDRDDFTDRIDGLREDIRVFQRGDETQAGTWKAHFLDLAKAVGVPRLAYGVVKDPNVDAVMTYVGQVMPAYKLLQRVDELEKRLDGMVPPPTVTGPRTVVQKCQFCGVDYPVGAMFCPRCGKEPTSEPVEGCETCASQPDDCYPDPPGSGSCEHYKPKGSTS